MPANLLSVLLTWFASHLVIFSLLGFLFAGLHVFGVFDATPVKPSDETAATAEAPVTAGSVSTPVAKTAPVGSEPEAGPEQGRAQGAPPPAKPVPRQPKLIGGSLPIYDNGRSAQAFSEDGAFRPPGDEIPGASVIPTRDEYLQQARRAFWNGDFEGAEVAYMGMVAAFPGDADAFGELGNLYQSMGKPDQALDAYYEAGVRLKDAGDLKNLQQIIDLLTEEGDARAARLAPDSALD